MAPAQAAWAAAAAVAAAAAALAARHPVVQARVAGLLGASPRFCVGLCTIDTPDNARKLAHALVDQRLVACVNILPSVTSVYKWDGEVQEDQEQLLVMKTRCALKPSLTAFIQANHPYDVPEVIFTPIDEAGSSAAYLTWVAEQTAPASPRSP